MQMPISKMEMDSSADLLTSVKRTKTLNCGCTGRADDSKTSRAEFTDNVTGVNCLVFTKLQYAPSVAWTDKMGPAFAKRCFNTS